MKLAFALPMSSDGDKGEAGTDLVIVRAGLTYIHAGIV
jgi:hypothetical protein